MGQGRLAFWYFTISLLEPLQLLEDVVGEVFERVHDGAGDLAPIVDEGRKGAGRDKLRRVREELSTEER